MAIKELKQAYEYGLTPEGLIELVRIAPETKVCMKLRTNVSDSRPVMSAAEALKFSNELQASNYKNGSIRELWIVS